MKTNIIAPAAALALVGAIASGVGIYELSRMAAPPRRPFLVTFDLSADAQARTSIIANKKTKAFNEARALANSAIRESAYNNVSRLRLVYIDATEHGRPTAEGLKFLQQSYDLAPYDPHSASWRTLFVLEHWGDMTPAIRAAAQREALAFMKVGSKTADIRSTLKRVRNPEGRVASTLWLMSLE